MRPLINRRGKFTTPASLVEGVLRRAELSEEYKNILRQLGDETRAHRAEYTKPGTYEAWRKSAEEAINLKKVEMNRLDEWLNGRRHVEELCLDAWRLLRTLEAEIELDANEVAVIRKLDAFFEDNKGGNA